MQDEPTLQNQTRKKAMLAALEKCYGIVTDACKIVGLARCTHYDWLKEDPEYKAAVEDIDNVALDHTESKLHQLIEGVLVEKDLGEGETIVYQKEPNVTAVIFHLKTRGKKRGYVEKEPEKDDTENSPITIKRVIQNGSRGEIFGGAGENILGDEQ
mgnify:CR=1 FL=1